MSFKAAGGQRGTHAAFLAVLVAAAGTALGADQPKAPTLSAALQKPLAEIQGLLKDKKFPEALDKLHAADALPGKTPYDQHVIYQMTAFVCAQTNDAPCVDKALQGEVDDGFTAPEDNQKFTRLLTQLRYQAKDYDKAIDFGNRAIKGGFATDETYGIVGAAYYFKDDFKGAVQFEEARIADVIKKGQTPKSDELTIYQDSCVQTKDDACIARALEYQVTYYPKPKAWEEVLSLVHPKGDVETLQTYRLIADVGAMNNADDYLDMAHTALARGSAGDAEHALQMGTDAGAFKGSRAGEAQGLMATAKKAAAIDQASLSKGEQEADASANGLKNASTGLAYLGYQQYDKAVDQLSKALSKGGLKNEADTRLDLGIAQLRSGHKDDAVKTFQSVHGSPVLERLAALWAIHAKAT